MSIIAFLIEEPRARRMPISRVFCVTIFAINAKIPTALSSRSSAVIALRSATSTRCIAKVFASRSRILKKPEKGWLGSALARARCIWPVCFGEGSPRQNRNLQRSEIIRCGVYHVGSGFLPRFFTVADGYVSRNYRPLVWQAQANSGLLHSGNLLHGGCALCQ